ncbi:10635_t:CDS:10 [Acaulospora colombiana]|uniref:10635_t:CDS:1 n=1 Tax=Acaulospora colombiana TaxID=27376 RepID=A0ACA9JVU1_9GLOM|nr:10635_t:CDS:10 [Acaulospora colombiana]
MTTRAMNPLDPNSFKHRFSFVNGITYHYVDEGKEDSDSIILLHGFPDLWYGWRYQIPHLVSKGYRVIVPDLRGYGQTEAPKCPPNDLHIYGFKNVCKDLTELMSQLKIKSSIFIGHDWGGFLAWRMCIHHPERVKAVLEVNVRFSLQHLHPLHAPKRELYCTRISGRNSSESAIPSLFVAPEGRDRIRQQCSKSEAYLKAVFRSSQPEDYVQLFDGKNMMGNLVDGLQRSPLISQQELDYYAAQYKNHGFHGGLNWYKTRKVNYQDEKGARKQIHNQALMITVGKDLHIPPSMSNNMHKFCKDLTVKHIEDAGHWVMIEKPQQLHEYLDEFLENVKNKELNAADRKGRKARL